MTGQSVIHGNRPAFAVSRATLTRRAFSSGLALAFAAPLIAPAAAQDA